MNLLEVQGWEYSDKPPDGAGGPHRKYADVDRVIFGAEEGRWFWISFGPPSQAKLDQIHSVRQFYYGHKNKARHGFGIKSRVMVEDGELRFHVYKEPYDGAD